MLLGVEHLVRQLFFIQQLRDDLGVFDRGGTHQHRLTAFIAIPDVLDGGLIFFARGLVHPVKLVLTPAGTVGRHHHGLQPVDFLEFVGFGIGRSGHTRELAIQPEIVLEGDRRHGLVFWLDRHPFLGLDRLMQAFAPAPPAHQASGEFVHDHDFILLHHVVLVAVVQVFGPQRCIQVVHQRDIGRVIEGGTFRDQPHLEQDTLGVLMTLLGQEHLATFFIQGEIARLDDAFASTGVGLTLLLLQLRHSPVDGDVQAGVVFGLAADDQRRASLVDQDGVHLVDDGVIETTLHPVCHLVDHVIAQVIKAVFVIGAVSDVGTVGRLFFFARHVGQVDAH